MKVYEHLLNVQKNRGAGYLVLLDPDKQSPKELAEVAKICELEGVDALLVGGSLVLNDHFDQAVAAIKNAVNIPVILFPGNGRQLSGHADAIFFMSLLSGRNPQYLIGEQVLSAPLVKALGLEAIPIGYLLVESGSVTSAQFMSGTQPIPRNKPEIAIAHALAAEYLGMKFVYLEAGSGAKESVPDQMIQKVAKGINIPLIIGGGIRTPEEAGQKVNSGASFVVTGNVLEMRKDVGLIRAFVNAIHQRG